MSDDNGSAIEFDLKSSVRSVFEDGKANFRYILGYVTGEFEELDVEGTMYVAVYYKANVDMEWQSVVYQLNTQEKIFKQKLPAVSVIKIYARLYGSLTGEFSISDFKVSVDPKPIGKFGSSLLLIEDSGSSGS